MKPIVFLSFLLTVHGIANVFEGSFSLNGIEYYYQGDSDPEISWYDAYWICKDNGFFAVEYVSVADWSIIKNQLPIKSEVWIGLIFFGDRGWWAYGREFKDTADFMDKDNWKGTKPFTKTYTTPECTRTDKSGGELKWELKSCEETDARAFCQSKKYVQGEPFRIGGSSSFAFVAGTGTQADAARSCSQSSTELITIGDADVNRILHNHLQNYAGCAGANCSRLPFHPPEIF